jgi:UDPglucose--hexose-1-phosphate uridylyltransferase
MSLIENTLSANPNPDPLPPTEIRRDSIINRWVIFAPARAARPNEYSAAPPAHGITPCPFCQGNEHLATPEIASIKRPVTSPQEEPGWQVRVVPNKYPALSGVPTLDGDRAKAQGTEQAALGIHEIIIESPRHLKSLSELTGTELTDVLTMYRDRLAFAASRPEIRHAIVFKNVGPGAGASMEHLHSQLIGLPLVPTEVAEELSAARTYREQHGACIFCDLVDRERATAARLVEETASFVAFCPYAARFPLETWVLPKAHESRYDRISAASLPELADLLKRCIERIERSTGRSEYNYLIHSAPFDTCSQSHYHWHIEIFPRLARTAGFEWGTGMFINSQFPEEAARKLRAALS